jgi:cell wall-associated NlpC family hydrolase
MPPAPVGSSRLGFDDIARYAYQAGFRGQALQYITAIAMRESGGNPAAYNPNVHTGDQSWGLLQVNTLGSLAAGRRAQLQSLGYSGDFHDLLDPAVNMKMAYKLSNGGTNFEPWRSASPGWGGPQGFLTNATQYLSAAGQAASRVQLGNANSNGQMGQAITMAQSGGGSAQSRMVSWLQQQVGKDYVAFTKGPNTFDCSGLTSAMLDQLGVHTPAFTLSQAQMGMQVSTTDLQPGDLVFFHGAPMAGHPDGNLGHVGVYIGGGQYIQAPHTGAKVMISTLDPNRVQMARRLVDGQGRYITGGGPGMPQLDSNVQTVPIGQAAGVNATLMSSTSSQPQGNFNVPGLNLGGTGTGGPSDTSTPTDAFTLPTHDFANILPGLGSKVESLV